MKTITREEIESKKIQQVIAHLRLSGLTLSEEKHGSIQNRQNGERMTRTIEIKPIGVEFIDKMGSDQRVCNAARVSFSKWNDESQELTQGDKGLLSYLATGLPANERNNWEALAKANTHWTPFAHCFLSIRVNVPFFLARQLHKHTVGLVINEESRRYIKSDIALWLPDVVHKAPEHAKQGASDEEHNSPLNTMYFDLGDITAKKRIAIATKEAVEVYYNLVDSGVAPEEARIVLPLNAMTQWVWSGSLLAFARVYALRKDAHAQGAARDFAKLLGAILYEHFPESMKALNYDENYGGEQRAD